MGAYEDKIAEIAARRKGAAPAAQPDAPPEPAPMMTSPGNEGIANDISTNVEVRDPVATTQGAADFINTADMSNYRGGRDIEGGDIQPDPNGKAAVETPATSASRPVEAGGPALLTDADLRAAAPEASKQQTPVDPYRATISSIAARRQQQAAAGAKFLAWKADNAGVDPATALDVLHYSETTGKDPEFVAKNLDAVKKQAKQDDDSWVDAVRRSPALMSWMDENRIHAAAVKDDAPNLSWLEQMKPWVWGPDVGRAIGAFGPTLLQAGKGQLQVGRELLDLMGLGSGDNTKAIAQGEQEAQAEGDHGVKTYAGQAVLGAARMAPVTLLDMGFRALGGIGGALVGLWAGAGGGAAAGLPEGGVGAAPGLIVGGVTGAAAGAETGQLAGSALFNGLESAAQLDHELQQVRDRDGNALSPTVRKTTAWLGGLGTGALLAFAGGPVGEKVAGKLEPLIAAIPGGKAILSRYGTKAVAEAIADSGWVANADRVLARWGAHTLSGGLTMAAQNATMAASQEAARAVSGESFDARWSRVGHAYVDGFRQGLQDMPLMALWGTRSEIVNENKRALFEEVGRESNSVQDSAQLKSHIEAAAASKTLNQMPAKDAADLISRIHAKPGAPEKVYVDAGALAQLAKSKGMAPEEYAKILAGDGGKAYAEAQTSGGPVVVKGEEFTAFAAAHPDDARALWQDAKLAQDTFTPRQMKGRMEQLRNKVAAQSSLPASQMDDSQREVYEDIRAKAVASGAPDAVADANARLVAAFFQARSEQFRENGSKLNAWDLYRPGAPRIFGPKGETLENQPGVEPATLAKMRGDFASLTEPQKQERFFRDEATGLYSFRGYKALHEKKAQDFAFGANAGEERPFTATFQPVGVKPINDYLGHDATDHALKVMANALRDKGETQGARRGNTISLDVKSPEHAAEIAKAMQDRLGIPVQHGVAQAEGLAPDKRTQAADDALKAAKGETMRKAFAPQFTEGEQPIDYRAGEPVRDAEGNVQRNDAGEVLTHPLREGMHAPGSDEAKVIESTAADKARPFVEKWRGEERNGQAEILGQHVESYAEHKNKADPFDTIHLTKEGLLTEEGYREAEKVVHQQAQDLAKAKWGEEGANKLVKVKTARGEVEMPQWRKLVHYVSADARGIADINDAFGAGLSKDEKGKPTDQVMRHIERALRDGGGPALNVARPHGDEFYAVFLADDAKVAKSKADRLFKAVDDELSAATYWRLHGDKAIFVPGLRLAHGIGPDFDTADREALPRAKEQQGKPPKPDVVPARDIERVARRDGREKSQLVRVGGSTGGEDARAEGAVGPRGRARGTAAEGRAGNQGRGAREHGSNPTGSPGAEGAPGRDDGNAPVHVAEEVTTFPGFQPPTESQMQDAREFAAHFKNAYRKAQVEEAIGFFRDYLAGRDVERYGNNPFAALPNEVQYGLALHGVVDPVHGPPNEENARRMSRGGKRQRRDITARDTGQADKRAEFYQRIGRKGPGDLAQPAWHGSPHEFDKFDINKVGTGEGSQIYGHGIYFGGKQDVAENYTEIHDTNGHLYSVDIPDSNELMDWHLPLSQQPAAVREALSSIKGIHPDANGAEIYFHLQDAEGSQKAASQKLKELGIPGLQYRDAWGREPGDKTNDFVIWDENRIAIKDKLYQPPEGGRFDISRSGSERGYISFDPLSGGKPLKFDIHLLNKADPSTLSHELFHYLSHAMGELAQREDAPEQLKSDYAEMIKWMGYDSHEQRVAEDTERRELGAKKRLTKDEQKRLKHITAKEERATHGWEQFLLEGKAPSMELVPIFTRIRNWMVGIYRSIRAIQQQFRNSYGEDINLSDPVRQVFGRLLAANDEVERAQVADSMQPFRPLAETMTPEERAAYEETARLRDSEQESEMVRRLSTVQHKENTEHLRKAREDFRKAATEEIDKNPVQRALRFLQQGELPEGEIPDNFKKGGKPYKIDREAMLKDKAFGPDAVRSLPRNVFAKKGEPGLHPDDMAAMLGFDGGRAMVDGLAKSTPREQAISAEVDRRMREKFSSITENPNALMDQSLRALPNDRAVDMVIRERRALAKIVDPNLPPEALDLDLGELKKTVDQIIRNKSVGELLAGKEGAAGFHRRAAAAAAKRMKEAFLKGNTREALSHNETHLVNLLMWRAANDLREHMESVTDDMKQAAKGAWREALAKADAAAALGSTLPNGETPPPVYGPAHDAIMQAVGILPGRPNPNALDAVLAGVSPENLGFDPDQIKALLADPTKWKGLDAEDAQNVFDAIKSIRNAANHQNELEVLGKKMDRDAFFASLKESAAQGAQVSPRGMNAAERGVGEKISAGLRGMDAWLTSMHTYVDQLEADREGPLHKLAVDQYRDGRAKAAELDKATTERVRKAIEEMPKDLRDRLSERIERLPELLPIPEQWKGRVRAPESRSSLYAIFLNWGNAGNRQRLLDGYGWTEANVIKALGFLRPEEGRFLQSMLDTIQSLRPDLEKVYLKRTGLPLGTVEATPIAIGGKAFAGGYFPIRYHPELAKEGVLQQGDIEKELFGPQHIAPSVFSGFTKARAQKVVAPLSLDFNVLPSHLMEVTHDIALGDWVREMAGVIRDQRFADAAGRRIGPEATKLFMPWVRDIATQRSGATMAALEGTPGAVIGLQAIFRNRMARSVMQLNLPSMFAHLTDPLAILGHGSAAEIPAKLVKVAPMFGSAYLKVYKSWAAGPRSEWALSKEIQYRQARELDNLREDFGRMKLSTTPGVRQVQKASDVVNHYSNLVRYYLDDFHSKLIYQAGYDEGIAKGMTKEEAARHGDDLLARTLPSGDIAEKSAILRSKAGIAAVVTFHGYANRMWNTWMHPTIAGARDAGAPGVGWGKRAATAADLGAKWLSMGAIAALGATLAGRGKKDDQDTADFLALKTLLEPLNTTPLIGPIIESIIEGKNPDVRSAPEVEFVAEMAQKFGHAARAGVESGETVDGILAKSGMFIPTFAEEAGPEIGSMAIGGPTAQISRTARYLQAASEGTAPTGPIETPKGIAFGPPRGP